MVDDKKLVKVPSFNVKPSLANTKKLATDLTKFIDDNKLSSQIAGKRYVQVEGWQFAGSQLGLVAIPNEAEDISKAGSTELRYKSSVDVFHVATGALVSRGFAICSNKENKKKSFDEYAIASMAQTRAIGKAYRNNLAWLIRLAGFEATPVEEIDRDILEEDMGKVKTSVFARFKAVGIDNSERMLEVIEHATGKRSIDNVDDAMAVLAELSKED
jgi:hypothetical protein